MDKKLLRNVFYMFAVILASAALGYAVISKSPGGVCPGCPSHASDDDSYCAGDSNEGGEDKSSEESR